MSPVGWAILGALLACLAGPLALLQGLHWARAARERTFARDAEALGFTVDVDSGTAAGAVGPFRAALAHAHDPDRVSVRVWGHALPGALRFGPGRGGVGTGDDAFDAGVRLDGEPEALVSARFDAGTRRLVADGVARGVVYRRGGAELTVARWRDGGLAEAVSTLRAIAERLDRRPDDARLLEVATTDPELPVRRTAALRLLRSSPSAPRARLARHPDPDVLLVVIATDGDGPLSAEDERRLLAGLDRGLPEVEGALAARAGVGVVPGLLDAGRVDLARRIQARVGVTRGAVSIAEPVGGELGPPALAPDAGGLADAGRRTMSGVPVGGPR